MYRPRKAGAISLFAMILPALAIALPRWPWWFSFCGMPWLNKGHGLRAYGQEQGCFEATHFVRTCFAQQLGAGGDHAGLVLAEVIGGSVIIEQVFMLPGVGDCS